MWRGAFLMVCAVITACGAPDGQRPKAVYGSYMGADTRLLDDDLVNFRAKMRGSLADTSLTEYTDCLAAGYALVRNFTHARHLRTNVYEEGGIQVADAIYTLSKSEPRGIAVIDAAQHAATCEARGIPTV